ncbi:hypothetical protein ARMGADRAFT_1041056 [Armillaria gallica]|uniref:Uncharacterized protein n=1 Tax=Armillaria gallica TaxID=47427 RepID=A0A2H3CUT8_ARMGA|nr:hypothetical protein ARMGADRAFT_1041056 [Armillaria gallica]
MLFLTHLPLLLSLSTLPSSALPYSVLMSFWFSFKLVGRQPFFKMDKTKKKLGGEQGKAILFEALCRFGAQVWWSGTCTLTISAGWHSSNNLSKLNHYTIRGFNTAGNLVFTAELANRVVDSEAWVYRAGEAAMTFEANKYGRVARIYDTLIICIWGL